MKHFLSVNERNVLLSEHRHEHNKRMADRLKTILWLDAGWSYEAIAEALFLNDSTIRRYEKNYLKGGIECLLTDNYTGGFGFLTEAQEALLKEHLMDTTYLSCKEIVEYVKETFAISYTSGGMLHLLKRLGFVYKKPKRVPGKANAKAQKEFVKEYERILENKGEKDTLYFMDATHPQHNPIPTYGWILKGQEKTIPTNTGRKRININGALDTVNMDVVIQVSESVNAESTIKLFQLLEKQNPEAEKIYVIADNARYYRAKAVKEYLETSKIVIVFLPPYAPNLNLIERFWKFFKKKVLGNEYYDTYDKFKHACLEFFDRIGEYEEELRSLLTNNFEIIQA